MRGSSTERFLRVGLAFAFLYPAISAWFNPYAWIGYFPDFLLSFAGSYDMWLLHAFGVTEILIALWLLASRRVFWPSMLAAVYLVGIVVFNLNQLDVIFRDISILAMALALGLLNRSEVAKVQEVVNQEL